MKRKMNKSDKIINFLKAHELISINALEKKCGLSQGTMAHALNGSRGLPEKYHESLIKELKRYGCKAC